MVREDCTISAAESLLEFADGHRWTTIYADPPWVFENRTGKMAPEHKRLFRYPTMTMDDILELPVAQVASERAHLYLWIPNALLAEGLETMKRWGFTYKTNIVWHKVRRDGGSDGRGVGFYFRNVTELVLLGVRGKGMRTLDAGRRQVNCVCTRKREHSRKPDEMYDLIESCSPGPYLELFQRGPLRTEWHGWGSESKWGHAKWQGAPNLPRWSGPGSAKVPPGAGGCKRYVCDGCSDRLSRSRNGAPSARIPRNPTEATTPASASRSV